MREAVAPDRLGRALDFVNERDQLSPPLSFQIAERILERLNQALEGKPYVESRAYFEARSRAMREAVAAEPGLDETDRRGYRKVFTAYWRFPRLAADTVEYDPADYAPSGSP